MEPMGEGVQSRLQASPRSAQSDARVPEVGRPAPQSLHTPYSHMYICICIHKYIHIRICMHMDIYIYVCFSIYVYVNIGMSYTNACSVHTDIHIHCGCM